MTGMIFYIFTFANRSAVGGKLCYCYFLFTVTFGRLNRTNAYALL